MNDFQKEFISSLLFHFKGKRSIEKYRQKALNGIVKYAYVNCPYYNALYKDVDFSHDIELSKLPVTNKEQIMARYEDCVADRNVKKSDIFDFIKDIDNCKRLLYDKYMVIMTSGSTGGAVSVLYDKKMVNHLVSSGSIRSFADLKELFGFLLRGKFVVTVCQNVSFGVANQVNQHNIAGLRHQDRTMTWVHSLDPLEKIVSRLNELKPSLLNTYPSTLELLCDEQEAGRLNIHPAVIACGGEKMDDKTRLRAGKLFNAHVHSNYSCSEGGTIANECSRGHLHINEDSVIIEAVDENGNPVADGEKSAKIYLTNLINRVQPVIRYEITDCVTIHSERCGCGKKSKWLEISGRTADVLRFDTKNGVRGIPSFGLYMRVYDLLCLKRFQVIVHRGNIVELRIVPSDGFDLQQAFDTCAENIKDYLGKNGVSDVRIILSEREPERDEKNMKFKAIYQVAD